MFSVCQFLSTPIIGRLSDKYGRKPLLLISIAGTAVSFFMAAFAPNAIFLYLARALDGLTAGNIPVAAAVISDTTAPKDRAKGFGIIGASFGFGFVFGPAISAFTVGINPALPFIIAGVVATIAVILTAILLPETNKHIGQVHKSKLFDIPKLLKATVDPNVGTTLLITLFFNTAFGILIFAYQPFSVKEMHLSANQIATNFTLIGIIGLICQALILPRLVKRFHEKTLLSACVLLAAGAFLGLFLVRNLILFIITTAIFGFANSFVAPLIQTILSRETDEKSQGSIQGLNASYVSIGTIVGPLLGGTLATFAIRLPFIASATCALICFWLSFKVLRRGVKKESAWGS
ncbi:MFS transporter [Candidatus Curtissbacteria bacterium]|nr:MFS transporter [Candidatus Curtissbacteria bacterium]